MEILVKDTYVGDVRCVPTWNGYEMWNNDTNEYYGKLYIDIEDIDEEEREEIVSTAIKENEDDEVIL